MVEVEVVESSVPELIGETLTCRAMWNWVIIGEIKESAMLTECIEYSIAKCGVAKFIEDEKKGSFKCST